jgi:hypothetical protein
MTTIQTISATEYIGDSYSKIFNNFGNISGELCNILTFLDTLSSAFGSRAIGITSLDHSVYFSARFVENRSALASDYGISFANIYPPTGSNPLRPTTNLIYRQLNAADYNCKADGTLTTGNNGFYTLDPSTGIVTVPAGIYRVDSEVSAYYTDTHISNLVNAVTDDVLLYGTAEYSDTAYYPTTTTYSKMHGRLVFPTETKIRIKQYIKTVVNNKDASLYTGLGYTFSHASANGMSSVLTKTTPNLYFAFINIQKIQDYTPPS